MSGPGDKARYWRRKLAGLCVWCGGPLEPDDGVRCAWCRDVEARYRSKPSYRAGHRRHARAYRARNRDALRPVAAAESMARYRELRAAGLCTGCKQPATAAFCPACAAPRAERQRARRRARRRARPTSAP